MAILDTLGDGAAPYVISFTAQTDVWDGLTSSGGQGTGRERRLKLTGIRWVGNGAATDHCVVTNRAGHTIWEAYAGAAQYVVESKIFKELTYIDYIAFTTLTSGTVYFYYE